MPQLPDNSPAFKTFVLQQKGLSPDHYDLTDDGQIVSRQQSSPTVAPALSPAPSQESEVLTKPDTSVGGSLLHSAESSAFPTGVGLGSAALGVGLAPETGGLSLAIPLIAGMLGSYAGSKIQEPFLSDQFKQQQAAEQQQHPIASTIGGFAPGMLAFNPLEGLANAPTALGAAGKLALGRVGVSGLTDAEQGILRNAAMNAGIQGGQDVAGQLLSGQPFSPTQLGVNMAGGALLNEPWGLGKLLFPGHANAPMQGEAGVQAKPPGQAEMQGIQSPEMEQGIANAKFDQQQQNENFENTIPGLGDWKKTYENQVEDLEKQRDQLQSTADDVNELVGRRTGALEDISKLQNQIDLAKGNAVYPKPPEAAGVQPVESTPAEVERGGTSEMPSKTTTGMFSSIIPAESAVEKAMNKTTRYQEEPEDNIPYGFWISPSGEMVPVNDYQGHEDKAYELMNQRYNGKNIDYENSMSEFPASEALQNKGWHHAVYNKNINELSVGSIGQSNPKALKAAKDYAIEHGINASAYEHNGQGKEIPLYDADNRTKYQTQTEQTPVDDNDPYLLRNASPEYQDAVQRLAAKRGITLKEAIGLTRPETGKEVLGAYNPATREAAINPNRAELDTPIHEGVHGYLDDLQGSARPADRNLYQRALGIFGGDKAQAEEALVGKLGVSGVPRVEEQLHGFSLRQFNSWFSDYVARWKNTLGVASDKDVIQHLSARYQHDAPYGTRSELNPSLRYTGFQPGMAGREGFKMYTATDDIKDKNGNVLVPKDSTVSDKSLESKGINYQEHSHLLRPTDVGYNDLSPADKDEYARLHGDAMVARKEHEVGGEGKADNLIDKELALKRFSESKGMKYQEESQLGKEHQKDEHGRIAIPTVQSEGQEGINSVMSFKDFVSPRELGYGKAFRAAVKNGYSEGEAKQFADKLFPHDAKYQQEPSDDLKLGLPKASRKLPPGEGRELQFPLTRSANDTIIKQEGERARPFVNALGDYYNQKASDMSAYKQMYNKATADLSEPEKAQLEQTLMKENRDKTFYNESLSEHLQSAYNGVRDMLRKMQEDRIEANQPVKAVDEAGKPVFRKAGIDPYYYPNQISPKVIEALHEGNTPLAQQLRTDWDNFQQAHGMTPLESKESLNAILGSYNKAAPNLAHFRGVDVEQGHGLPESFMRPGMDRNMDRYVNRYVNARAYHDNIESNPTVSALMGEKTLPWGVKNPSEEQPLQGNVAKDVIHRLKGQDYTPGEGFVKSAERVASSAMLGPLTNIHILGSTTANALAHAMPSEVAGMVTHMATDLNKATQHAVDLGNIRQTRPLFQNLFDAHATMSERLNTLADGISRLSGRNITDRLAKGLAQAGGEYLVNARIPLAAMGDKQAIRFMKAVDPEWQAGKVYTDAEKIQLAGNFSNILHGVHDPRTQPNWMLKDNIVQPFTSLMSWNIAQTNNFMKHVLTPATQGEYRPLIMNTLGALLGGYIIKQGREALSNKKSPIPSFNEIAAGPGGIAGSPGLDTYNLLAMSSYAGFGGIMSLAARSLFDLKYKNPAQGAVFPLDEVLSGTASTVTNAATALMNSHDPHETMQIGIHAAADLFKNNVQAARIAMSWLDESGALGTERERQKKLQGEEGDLRRWKQVEGMPTTPNVYGEDNPYLNLNRKMFQRDMDIGHAAQRLPDLIKQSLDESNGNVDVFKQKLQALKDGAYPSFPSIDHTPRLFFNYLNYLQKTEGTQAATDRMIEYLKNNQINKIKGEMVPTL